MKSANRYIQFEIETRMSPFGIFGGGGDEKPSNDDDDYEEVTEDDVNALARILGGG